MPLKKRSPFLAFLLSAFYPGLGQLYNTHIQKAAVFSLSYLGLGFLYLTVVPRHFEGLVSIFILYVFIWFANVTDAVFIAFKMKTVGLKRYNRWFVYLSWALVWICLPYSFKPFLPYSTFNIPGAHGSMSPTLLGGDYFLIDLKAYQNGQPQCGDIIVFRHPETPDFLFVKRVVAVEGQTIQTQGRETFINGQKIEEPYLAPQNPEDRPLTAADTPPTTIPAGKLFVMGDNRDRSSDSRYWGLVDVSAVIGKPLYVYFSRQRDRIGKTL